MSVVASPADILLRRGKPIAAENQYENARLTRDHLAAIADQPELMISPEKGLHVRPPAWRQPGIESRLINRARRGFRSPEIDTGGKSESGELPAARGRMTRGSAEHDMFCEVMRERAVDPGKLQVYRHDRIGWK